MKNPLKTKFQVGEEVRIPSEGRTGTILMVQTYPKVYLVDCHPGAAEGFIYVTITFPNGEIKPTTANWFPEKQLKPIKAR